MIGKVLVVEDEPSILESVLYALRTEGIAATCAETLEAARSILQAEDVSLLVLDVGLPDGNGFDFCREIRNQFSGPVLFLTARSSEVDRIVGLEMGGGDYVTKPFSPRELTARVRNLLRRTGGESQPSVNLGQKSRREGLCVNSETATVSFGGSDVAVSASELRLLTVMAAQPGRVFSRDGLMTAAWEDPGASLDRTVDSHIKNLRAKLRQVDPDCEVIRTHRGLGYSLNPDLCEKLR